jgi:hypothetical protein
MFDVVSRSCRAALAAVAAESNASGPCLSNSTCFTEYVAARCFGGKTEELCTGSIAQHAISLDL